MTVHVAIGLLMNAILAWGVFYQGWSIAMLLALMWWENFIGVLQVGTRQYLYERAKGPEYLGPGWLRRNLKARVPQLATLLVLGLFALFAAIVMLVPSSDTTARWEVHWGALGWGGAAILIVLTVDLLAELPRLARQPFQMLDTKVEERWKRIWTLFVVVWGFFLFAGHADKGAREIVIAILGFKTVADMATAGLKRRPPPTT